MVTIGETITDHVRVQAVVTANGSGKSSLVLFGTDAPFVSPVLFLELESGAFNNRMQFKSQTSLTTTGTVRGNTFGYSAVTGDVITAEYNPSDSTFRGYINGVERCTWVNGSGTTIPIGPGRRHHGVHSNMDQNSGEKWDSVDIYDVQPSPVNLISEGTGTRITGSSTTLATSQSHNVTETSPRHVLIVTVASSISTNTTDDGATVTYSGQSMTLVSQQYVGSSTSRAWHGTYYLFNPPTGNNTVSVTSTGTGTKTAIAIQSILYRGVSSVLDVGAITTLGLNVTGTQSGEVYILNTTNGGALSTITSPGRMSYVAGSSVGGVGDYAAFADFTSIGGTMNVTFSGTASTPGMLVTELWPW